MRIFDRKLLYITHQFPPCGGTSVRRATKIVKYLSRYGWQIFVLTPHHGNHSIYRTYWCDEALEYEIPNNVEVIRSFTPESLWDSRPDADNLRSDNRMKAINWRWIFRRLIKSIKNYLLIPEGSVAWIPFAVWRGFNLIKQNQIKIIYVTAPHFSITLTGGILKILTNVCLVTEFRDAWTSDPARSLQLKIHGVVEKWMETWVVKMSDCVICVTGGVRDDFVSRYSSTGDENKKYFLIPNGFDLEDKRVIQDSKSRNKSKKFRMVYTGVLGRERTPKFLLLALGRLLINKPQLRSKLEVVFVGNIDRFSDGKSIEDYIRQNGLDRVVFHTGPVTREESLHFQASADLLLLITGLIPDEKNRLYGVHGKIFDYILTETAVLALAGEGPIAELIRRAGIGEVIPHHDLAGIQEAILRAMDGRFSYSPNLDYLREYNFDLLCKQTSDLLVNLCN